MHSDTQCHAPVNSVDHPSSSQWHSTQQRVPFSSGVGSASSNETPHTGQLSSASGTQRSIDTASSTVSSAAPGALARGGVAGALRAARALGAVDVENQGADCCCCSSKATWALSRALCSVSRLVSSAATACATAATTCGSSAIFIACCGIEPLSVFARAERSGDDADGLYLCQSSPYARCAAKLPSGPPVLPAHTSFRR